MNPEQGKSFWLDDYLCNTFRNRRTSTPLLLTAIGFDDDRRDVVVLRIALHEGSGGVVDTVGNIRSRIVIVGMNIVEDTLGAELVSVGRGRFWDAISEKQRDFSGGEANCIAQCKLTSGEKTKRWAGAIQSALYLTRFEEHEAGDVA